MPGRSPTRFAMPAAPKPPNAAPAPRAGRVRDAWAAADRRRVVQRRDGSTAASRSAPDPLHRGGLLPPAVAKDRRRCLAGCQLPVLDRYRCRVGCRAMAQADCSAIAWGGHRRAAKGRRASTGRHPSARPPHPAASSQAGRHHRPQAGRHHQPVGHRHRRRVRHRRRRVHRPLGLRAPPLPPRPARANTPIAIQIRFFIADSPCSRNSGPCSGAELFLGLRRLANDLYCHRRLRLAGDDAVGRAPDIAVGPVRVSRFVAEAVVPSGRTPVALMIQSFPSRVQRLSP